MRLVITNAAPNFDGSNSPGSRYLDGTGTSAEAYSKKLAGMSAVVRSEIWNSILNNIGLHGSIKDGDYVRMASIVIAPGKVPDYLQHSREFDGLLSAELVKTGPRSGQSQWMAQWSDPPQARSLTVFPDSDAVFKALPSRQSVFMKAHPGKDYYAYRKSGEGLTTSSKIVVFRVDQALWK